MNGAGPSTRPDAGDWDDHSRFRVSAGRHPRHGGDRSRRGGQHPQRLQLVRLYRRRHGLELRGRDRHQGQLRHLRQQRGAGGQAARRQLRLRRRRADRRARSWRGRSRPASIRSSTSPSSPTTAISTRRSSKPVANARSGQRSTACPICGARSASATTSTKVKAALGADAPVDSWKLIFDPADRQEAGGLRHLVARQRRRRSSRRRWSISASTRNSRRPQADSTRRPRC